ncbi:MAG: hypothetical protein Q9220_006681 [cf. Caloplaca sp. 1 TL-2023]
MGDVEASTPQEPSNSQTPAEDSDSDWEYEYSTTEKESFYITIDTSSNSHHIRAPPRSKATPPPPPQPNPLPIDPALQQQQEPLQPPPKANPPPADPKSRIQILDLHTRNPLISYQNRIYTCTWGTTLGTDIFLSAPPAHPFSSQQPLKSYPDVDVLGTSCTQLTARLATIVPRTHADPLPTFTPTATANKLTSVPTDPAGVASAQQQAPPVNIPLPPTAPLIQRQQATFLSSLIQIKANRGETDAVTVHAQKVNQGTGWRVQRRLAAEKLAGDAAAEGGDAGNAGAEGVVVPRGGGEGGNGRSGGGVVRGDGGVRRGPRRGRGRGRGSGKKRGMGGLFRDYVPDVGDEMGAEFGGGKGTPRRWGDAKEGDGDGDGDVTMGG